MKRKRHSEEQILRKLGDADRMLSEGKEIGRAASPQEKSRA